MTEHNPNYTDLETSERLQVISEYLGEGSGFWLHYKSTKCSIFLITIGDKIYNLEGKEQLIEPSRLIGIYNAYSFMELWEKLPEWVKIRIKSQLTILLDTKYSGIGREPLTSEQTQSMIDIACIIEKYWDTPVRILSEILIYLKEKGMLNDK